MSIDLKKITAMSDLHLEGQRVLIREDLNVPLNEQGVITDTTRIDCALPTIEEALRKGAAVMLLSHLGRPTAGQFDARFSLRPVATVLSQLLHQEVPLISDWLQGVPVKPGQVVLLENVRFLVGEEENDNALAEQMALLCDIFVMDAFATAHRAQASTAGVSRYAQQVCAGPLLMGELQVLQTALTKPKRPLAAIVGGSKVSSKIGLLDHLLERVDTLLVGGGIANTLLAAHGFKVGASLYEADWLHRGQALLQRAAAQGVQLPLPQDVVVARSFNAAAVGQIKTVDAIAEDDIILDVGPQTQGSYRALLQNAATIVWNGPVGVFEWDAFAAGTHALAQAVADSPAYSIAGGGDTLAALAKFKLTDKMSTISTGGGAFLEFLEGKPLPGVIALQR